MKEDIKIESTDTFLIIFFQLVKFFFTQIFFFQILNRRQKLYLVMVVIKKLIFLSFSPFLPPLAHAHAPGIHGYWYQIFHSLASATVV